MHSKIFTIFLDNFDVFLAMVIENNIDEISIEKVCFFKKKTNIGKFRKRKNYESINKNKVPQQLKKAKDVIQSYFEGKNLDLYDELRNLGIKIPFEEKFTTKFSYNVIKTLLKCPYGEVTSYFEIGKSLGTKAYRAIGNVLKNNPLPLIIPCHRVIKKNGEIGGYMGKKINSWQTTLKRDLLKLEGIDL
jgi:O-6-methylguanine DNA methyltransferase